LGDRSEWSSDAFEERKLRNRCRPKEECDSVKDERSADDRCGDATDTSECIEARAEVGSDDAEREVGRKTPCIVEKVSDVMTTSGMSIEGNETTTHARAMGAPQYAREENRGGSKSRESVHSGESIISPGEHRNGIDAGLWAKCRHCGESLRTIRMQRRGFCCHGCEGAFSLISSLGLDSFYQLRERVGGDDTTQPSFAAADRRFGYLDDTEFQARYVELESTGLGRIVFSVPAIQCAACVWLLEKLPEVVRDIARVRVDIVRGRAAVWFDPRKARLSAIARTFAGLGYAPQPVSPEVASTQGADRALALRLGVAAFAAMNVMLLFVGRYAGLFLGMEERYAHFFAWMSLALSLPAVVFSAQPFFKSSLAALRYRRLHIDLPISIAIVGGFVASTVNTALGRDEIYFDTVTALVFLLLVGRWFQQRAMRQVGATSDLIFSLSSFSALRLGENDRREEVYVRSIRTGDRIVVPSGERIPADGIIERGSGTIDNSIVTGESRPVLVNPGDTVWNGARNIGPEVVVSVEAVGERSRLGGILEQAATATAREGRSARFVDRVSRYFVWGVIAIAVGTFCALLPNGFCVAWDRVMAFLVVTCPCALGIATPVVLHLATARAARQGILLKNGEALERLAEAKHILFDKTGTLTTGAQSVVRRSFFVPETERSRLWSFIKVLERDVPHPVGAALLNEAERLAESDVVFESQLVVPGFGVRGVLSSGNVVRVGSLRWLEAEGLEMTVAIRNTAERFLIEGLSTVALGVGDDIVALFGLGDTIRAEAQDVIHDLKEEGVSPAVVSGDSAGIVSRYADYLGIERRFGELSPEAKATLVRRHPHGAVFVGDGVNDAAALAAADVGIGVSGGAEATLAVSDIFLVKPDLTLIVEAFHGARATRRLIRTHLGISLVYNLTAGTLAVLGMMSPLMAAVVMPLSSLSVIGISLWRAPFRGEAR